MLYWIRKYGTLLLFPGYYIRASSRKEVRSLLGICLPPALCLELSLHDATTVTEMAVTDSQLALLIVRPTWLFAPNSFYMHWSGQKNWQNVHLTEWGYLDVILVKLIRSAGNKMCSYYAGQWRISIAVISGVQRVVFVSLVFLQLVWILRWGCIILPKPISSAWNWKQFFFIWRWIT